METQSKASQSYLRKLSSFLQKQATLLRQFLAALYNILTLFTELSSALDEAKQHSEAKLPFKQSEMTSYEVGVSFE